MEPKEVLLEELKKAGLDIAEESAIKVVKAVFKALPPFFLATETKIDDVAIAVLPVIEPYIVKALDAIDGEVDQA